MSTNKTPNYQLHSWLPEDEFHVAEINENFAGLDAGVGMLRDWASTACVAGFVSITDYRAPIKVDLGFRPKLVILGMSGYTYRFFRMCADKLSFISFSQGGATPASSVGTDSIITDTGFDLGTTYMIVSGDEGKTTIQYVAFR